MGIFSLIPIMLCDRLILVSSATVIQWQAGRPESTVAAGYKLRPVRLGPRHHITVVAKEVTVSQHHRTKQYGPRDHLAGVSEVVKPYI
jgi:hypothetical protein